MENVLDKLTEEQAQIALQIARKAKEMGVDPRLAIALAYRESGLNPQAKGGKGEVGLMQVMPATAKGLGFSTEDLANPSKNIEIGLTYLKRGLEKFDGDPVLAAAGYNAGLDHPYFSDPKNKPLPQSTKEYLKGINQIGGFSATSVPSDGQEDETFVEPSPPASENDFKLRMAMDAAAMAGGAGLAKVADVGSGVVGGARDIVRASRSLPGALSVLQSMQNAPPSAAPSMPPQAMPPQAMPPQGMPPQGQPQGAPRPVAGGPAGPVGGPASPLQQMGNPNAPGYMTRNYGTAAGLSPIEAARALDNTKQTGGVHDLLSQRRDALNKIQSMGGGYVENPNYSGIMTPERSVGSGPRASFVQTPGAPGGLSQLPPPAPVSAAPPPPPAPPAPPGALSQAGQGLKQAAGAVMRSPVVMGALGGLSMAESGQEAEKRFAEGDMPGAAIASAGVIGGGLQMAPSVPTKAFGAMISAASPLTLYLYDKLRGQGIQEPKEPTEQELMEASKPAFGIYPRTMPQPRLRPRTFAPGENMPPVESYR